MPSTLRPNFVPTGPWLEIDSPAWAPVPTSGQACAETPRDARGLAFQSSDLVMAHTAVGSQLEEGSGWNPSSCSLLLPFYFEEAEENAVKPPGLCFYSERAFSFSDYFAAASHLIRT